MEGNFKNIAFSVNFFDSRMMNKFLSLIECFLHVYNVMGPESVDDEKKENFPNKITVPSFYTALGAVLKNSKDWGGRVRKSDSKKNADENDANEVET